MEIEYQLSNGEWDVADDEQISHMIGCVLERESWYAPRVNREPMTTPEEVLERLRSGEELYYGDDWYASMRAKPAPLPEQAEARTVRCDCGHDCEPRFVLSASLGTACSPECLAKLSG